MPKKTQASLSSAAETVETAGPAWQDRAVRVVFPAIAAGLWENRRRRKPLVPPVIEEVFERAVELLYRLLLLFYAEARGKLPPSGADASTDSLDLLRAELAEIGGNDEAEVAERLRAAFSRGKRRLADRVQRLFAPLNSVAVSGRDNSPRPQVADDCVAIAIDGLSRRWSGASRQAEWIDYRRMSVRELGAIYERLLECRLETPATDQPVVVCRAKDKRRRKAGGCFYTPEAIVRQIVEISAGVALDEKLAAIEPEFRRTRGAKAARENEGEHELVERFFDFRVLDPAMGAGYFLVEAAEAIARRMAAFLDRFPGNAVSNWLQRTRPAARGPRRGGPAVATRSSASANWEAVKRSVVERCLFGIDLDPRAVALARLSLWLESSLPADSLPALGPRFRCGDALSSRGLDGFPGPGQFDAVVGNPPYGAKLDRAARRSLARSLPLMKSNSDTAVGFIERASHWLRPTGRAGLIVPKPLTYSYAWRGVRAFLHRRVERLIDVSRAWPDVRLEQVIVAFGEATASAAYRTAWTSAGRIRAGARISWALADRFGTLPCALTPAELKRAANLNLAEVTVGDVCRTFRGIPAQRWLAGSGPTPVIGGRDLERWRIRGASGSLPEGLGFNLAPFAREKLVFQNIIAHVARPRPHILLIGAYDARQTVTLDTVNNLVATDARVNLQGLCGLLHSRLVNWLVYSLIYNKAIRTMHFDQYFLNKIPLPPDWPGLLGRLAHAAAASAAASVALAEIARQAEGLSREQAPRLAEWRRQATHEIDRLVSGAYGAPSL